MKLKNWIDSAEEYYKTAQFLGNPLVEVKLKVPTLKSSWYLLHHSLELFLKAVLINHNKFNIKNSKIHNLRELLDKVSGLSPKIDKILAEKRSGRSIKNWILFINPFGSPNGGLRYLQKDSHIYAAPLDISQYFNKLVEIIKSESNLDKEITEIVS